MNARASWAMRAAVAGEREALRAGDGPMAVLAREAGVPAALVGLSAAVAAAAAPAAAARRRRRVVPGDGRAGVAGASALPAPLAD